MEYVRVRSHWRVSPRGNPFHVGEYFRRVRARGRKMLQSEKSRKHLKRALAAQALAGGVSLFHYQIGKKRDIPIEDLERAFRKRYGTQEELMYLPSSIVSAISPLVEPMSKGFRVRGYRIITPLGSTVKDGRYLRTGSALVAHELGHVPELRRFVPVGRISTRRGVAGGLGVQILYSGLPSWALSRMVKDPRKKDIAFALGYAPVIAMEAAASARGYKILKEAKGKVTPGEAVALVLSPVSYGAFAYGARQLQKAIRASREEEESEKQEVRHAAQEES